MEEKLLKIFKIADELNNTQDKVYAEITYTADDKRLLEISIRSKENYNYVEKCQIQLNKNSIIDWDNIILLFERFVGGTSNE